MPFEKWCLKALTRGWHLRCVPLLEKGTEQSRRPNYHYCYVCTRKDWPRVLDTIMLTPDVAPLNGLMVTI